MTTTTRNINWTTVTTSKLTARVNGQDVRIEGLCPSVQVTIFRNWNSTVVYTTTSQTDARNWVADNL